MAKTNYIRGQVEQVLEQGQDEIAGQSVDYQVLQVQLESGEQVEVRHQALDQSQLAAFEQGDQVFLSKQSGEMQLGEMQAGYALADFVRLDSIWILFAIFVLAVLAVSRWQGLKSLLSMLLSFAIIFLIILPLLMRGLDPVLVSMLGAILIIPPSFYLAHGFNKKTHVAVISTILALVVASFLAFTFVNNAKLTGFASEEAGFLQVEQQGLVNIKGLLIAGIIIGLLGTLDDVAVSQAGFVFQLHKANKKLSFKKLYQQAMEVGKDHISSMVNTLILVYTGASLPLLLLFMNNPQPIGFILNQEIVAEEIIRMLIGSIGVIMTAPLTTLLAAAVAKKKEFNLIK